jgi:hypothetical protein
VSKQAVRRKHAPRLRLLPGDHVGARDHLREAHRAYEHAGVPGRQVVINAWGASAEVQLAISFGHPGTSERPNGGEQTVGLPEPGTFAKTPCGPRTIRPVRTS